MPKMTFNVRQSGSRPRLPVGGGIHTMPGSNQIVRGPQRFSALLQDRQFLIV
ncbi:hypothetical protein C357_03540 [Citreicella sp. 357]|nr:hypothetical protein C357_03540 [Citreicella sp. 357]